MAEHFHYIDRNAESDFREQAYSFEQLNNEKFRISVAVQDLSLLSSHLNIRNVSTFIESVEAICDIGYRDRYYRKMQHHHPMMHDYQSGNKKLYKDKDGLYNNHIIYSAEVDFNLIRDGKRLCGATSNLKIEEKKPIICDLTSSFSDYGKEDLQTPGLNDALAFYDRSHCVYHLVNAYHKMLTRNKIKENSSVGCFLAWVSGAIIKECFALQDINDKKLNLVSTKYGLNHKPSFVPISSVFENKGYVYYPCLTTPLYDPVCELNRRQIGSFYNQGRSELGRKEIARLVVKLNNYVDNYENMRQNSNQKSPLTKPPPPAYNRLTAIRPDFQ